MSATELCAFQVGFSIMLPRQLPSHTRRTEPAAIAPRPAHRAVFRRLFREYGLPNQIRTDNGSPFASMALARLSWLSVWWIKLGILPDLIEPASPQQNGRHERMHRDLKAETTIPQPGTDPPSSGASTRFDQTSTRSGPTRPWGKNRPRPPMDPRPGRSRASSACPSTRHTSRPAKSPLTAVSASMPPGSMSPTCSEANTSSAKTSPRTSGPFPSDPSLSAGCMNEK